MMRFQPQPNQPQPNAQPSGHVPLEDEAHGCHLSIYAYQRGEFGRNYHLHTRNIERVILAMASHLDLPLTNTDMADIACISPCHFNRLFHKLTGIPPVQFHYAMRLSRAKELLITTELGITDICFEVGYNSLGTFVRRFSELVGLSPRAFRRLAREIDTRRLAEFPLNQAMAVPDARDAIAGTVEYDNAFDGLIFTALFQRAIPEGQPEACAILSHSGTYTLPVPKDGSWYVLSIAVPWTASGNQVLMLDGLSRGRSGSIFVENGRWSGRTAINLALPNLLDPPILVAIPLLMDRLRPRDQKAVHDSFGGMDGPHL
jgi:AraC family transcriptional regulator